VVVDSLFQRTVFHQPPQQPPPPPQQARAPLPVTGSRRSSKARGDTNIGRWFAREAPRAPGAVAQTGGNTSPANTCCVRSERTRVTAHKGTPRSRPGANQGSRERTRPGKSPGGDRRDAPRSPPSRGRSTSNARRQSLARHGTNLTRNLVREKPERAHRVRVRGGMAEAPVGLKPDAPGLLGPDETPSRKPL
jgi:hypothetical protein